MRGIGVDSTIQTCMLLGSSSRFQADNVDVAQKSNSGGVSRPMAGATEERKLLGVGSSAVLGFEVFERYC